MKSKKDVKQMYLNHPDADSDKKRCPATGSKNDDFANILLNQAINTMWVDKTDSEQIDKQIYMVMHGVMGGRPQDELEGMLVAQMVAAHNATMECFKRAMIPEQSVDSRDYNLKHAGKLMRAYAGMLEALNRYRGKGQQKMTVEHVHVHAGGQAIVGNVTQSQGGGVKTKTEGQAHAKQITNAPMPEMPCQNPQRKPMPIPRNA